MKQIIPAEPGHFVIFAGVFFHNTTIPARFPVVAWNVTHCDECSQSSALPITVLQKHDMANYAVGSDEKDGVVTSNGDFFDSEYEWFKSIGVIDEFGHPVNSEDK